MSQQRLRVALALERVQSGRTQGQIAVEAGIDPTVFSKIVRGWRVATPAQRASLAETLNKTEAELFGEPTEEGVLA